MEQPTEHNTYSEDTQVSPTSSQTPQKTNFLIPVAILLGFGMIAGAIVYSSMNTPEYTVETSDDTNQVRQNESGDPDQVNPVVAEDWIRGNPNAPIQIVEYSDYDCPFCKNFHETMQQIIDEYGPTGQVAWVYRHLPLAQLHPNAPHIAVASECVGNLGGNEAFWSFSDLVFGERETVFNDAGQAMVAPTDITRLGEFAERSGVSQADFDACLENGDYRENVEADFENALAVGGTQIGTPHSVVVVGDQTGVIRGAQEYPAVKQIVDNLIAQLNGTSE